MVLGEGQVERARSHPTLPPWIVALGERWHVLPTLTPGLPGLVAAAVLAGLAYVVAATPIGSGDYGQWLMTSRSFLGETVPAYRDLGAVPPIVPALIAVVRAVVPDPIAALHVTAIVLLVGIGSSLYWLGRIAGDSEWAGALTVAVGLLVTDRFTELFAFGGLLQAGALVFGIVSVTSLVRSARAAELDRGAWWFGVGALALAAVTHVGTGTIVVPIGLLLAGGILLVRVNRDLRALARTERWALVALGVIALYWLVVLRGASAGYIANPASLAYRGPDRLWELLSARWPTALVLVVGTATVSLGTLNAIARRRVDGFAALAAWTVVAWGTLGFAILTRSATDYPRFTTILLVPAVVGAALAALWALRQLTAHLRELGFGRFAPAVVPVVVIGLVLASTPLAIGRHAEQTRFYALRDATSLTAVAEWLETNIAPGMTVVADTREAKWIEGLTGMPALFSQHVRYAFRPIEWRRSIEADALLRSTETVTNGLVRAQLAGRIGSGHAEVPAATVIGVNHGGEMVDVFRLASADTRVAAAGGSASILELRPDGGRRTATTTQVDLVTRWTGSAARPSLAYTQQITAWADGTTLRIVGRSEEHTISTVLEVASGVAMTSLTREDPIGGVVACFTLLGSSEPCVRIEAAQPDATITDTEDGGLAISTTESDRLDILVTALTASDAAVPLSLLDPERIVRDQRVGAAVLSALDPSYGPRRERLANLGFVDGPAFGPYQVLVMRGLGSE